MSPKVKERNTELRKKHAFYRKKLYKANKKISKLKKEVTDLKTVTQFLRQSQLVSDSTTDHLEKCFDSVPQLLMRRYLKNIKNNTTTHEEYPILLKQFAATLQFFSAKAYDFVRNEFALSLPHQATIRKWFANVACNPGYVDIAFDTLKIKSEEAKNLGRDLVCSVIIDEMSIKKQIEFTDNKIWGYVDIGIPCENDELLEATEAFVIMVVSHQSHWKIPIAYFFIRSLSGREKANIVNETLIRLFEVGVITMSITCDGPSCNFTMLKELGCCLEDIQNMKTYFFHPADPNRKVYCILDPCHMLKLFRNNLASLQEFIDPNGEKVCWKYIQHLYEFQESQNIYVANKLRKAHMEWYKQKMKVSMLLIIFEIS